MRKQIDRKIISMSEDASLVFQDPISAAIAR